MAVMTGWRPLPGKRRWWTFAAVVMALALVLVMGTWWALREGYIPGVTATCTLEDFRDPVPSFERLVTEYGKSPYCARLVRDETWF